MNKFTLFASIILMMAMTGCTQKATVKAGGEDTAVGPGVVAMVDGQSITAEELAKAAKPDLQKIEMKIYQVKKSVLDELIDDRLVTQAAKKDGMSVEEYTTKMIDERIIPPTEEEIAEVYDARKGMANFSEPLDKMKERIQQYLIQAQRARLAQDLIAKLRAESDVKVMLDVPRVDVALDDAPEQGPRDAAVTVVEFSDYQCPFSGRVRETVYQLLDAYKDRVRYIYRDFPLSFHRDAQKAHEAAHCAGDQDKYFEYSRKLFANQKDLAVQDLKRYAKELDLDMKKFSACLDGSKHADEVEESMKAGQAAGVSGTPSFFINGIMLSGAQPLAAFTEIIDAELQR